MLSLSLYTNGSQIYVSIMDLSMLYHCLKTNGDPKLNTAQNWGPVFSPTSLPQCSPLQETTALSFHLLRIRPWSHLWHHSLSFSPYPIHQKTLPALYKSIYISRTQPFLIISTATTMIQATFLSLLDLEQSPPHCPACCYLACTSAYSQLPNRMFKKN